MQEKLEKSFLISGNLVWIPNLNFKSLTVSNNDEAVSKKSCLKSLLTIRHLYIYYISNLPLPAA